MVSVPARRAGVAYATGKGLSQRRACTLLGVGRSALHYCSTKLAKDTPVLARMGSKLIWTTIISAVIFAIAMWAYYQGYFNIERLAKLMGMPF